jgi:two-component system, OmpR family, alkaline phosphatase synthesis response regulator PhoP
MDEIQKTESKLNGKTILWVEDDAFLSEIITQKLNKRGCKYFFSKDSEQAFEVLKNNIPDVIVLDILLPGKDGFEILTEIKKDPKLAEIPVIMLTNFNQQEKIDTAMKLGAVKFLVKAIYTLEEILAEIEKTIK